MAKFEAPGFEEWVFMTVWIVTKLRFIWKKLLESKAFLSSNNYSVDVL